MHATLRTSGTIVAVVMMALAVTGCPAGIEAQRIGPDIPIDYNGPIYTPRDFWPLAVGNYWLWSDPEDPIGSISRELLKSQSIKGMEAFLVEVIPYVELGTYPTQYYYIIEHPKGLFKTRSSYTIEGSNEDLRAWSADPNDLSPLVPVLTGKFIPGTFPHPAAYDPNRMSTVGQLADVTPIDQCANIVPDALGGDPEVFLVLPEHLVLLDHGLGACEDGSRTRSAYDLYALGIGPLNWDEAKTLVRVVIDGHEFAL